MKTELLTGYHRKQSKAAMTVVKRLLKQPLSLPEAKLQVHEIKKQRRSTVKKRQL